MVPVPASTWRLAATMTPRWANAARQRDVSFLRERRAVGEDQFELRVAHRGIVLELQVLLFADLILDADRIDGGDDGVDERRLLAAVDQQARLAVLLKLHTYEDKFFEKYRVHVAAMDLDTER